VGPDCQFEVLTPMAIWWHDEVTKMVKVVEGQVISVGEAETNGMV